MRGTWFGAAVMTPLESRGPHTASKMIGGRMTVVETHLFGLMKEIGPVLRARIRTS
jgi:hypothetical protein